MFLLTTSRNSDPDLKELSIKLESTLPFSHFVRRGKKSLKDLSEIAYQNGFKGFIKVTEPSDLIIYNVKPPNSYQTKGRIRIKSLKLVNDVKELSPHLKIIGFNQTQLEKSLSKYLGISVLEQEDREGNYMTVKKPEIRIYVDKELNTIINVEDWEDL